MTTTIQGRLSLHPRGFGFLRDSEGESHFCPPPILSGFFLGDTCEAEVRTEKDGRTACAKLKLVKRDRTTLYGQATRRGRTWYLEPDPSVGNSRVKLKKGRDKTLKSGDWVLCSLDDKGATLETVFDKDNESERDVARVASRYGLDLDFAHPVKSEAGQLKSRLTRKSITGRRDLRDMVTVTIDAPSTKDIDDAIGVLPADRDGGVRLFVSIADVTNFIEEGTALDDSARERATSVYLINRVLPMFPKRLTEKTFSLLPERTRLTLTCEMRIDAEGQVTSVDIYESVIRSNARINYKEADDYLHDRDEPDDDDIAEAFTWFRTASARLELARRRRGGIRHDFQNTESKVEFDENGEPVAIVARTQNAAHRMIELFMVAANEAVAGWLNDRALPVLYRNHPEPEPDRVGELVRFARNFGFEPGFPERVTPLALAAFAGQVEGAPCEPAFFSVIMRVLGRASYEPDPKGHFGLASDFYLHFTSPIRRYADVLVHRVVKGYLSGRREPVDRDLKALGEHIGIRARQAMEAESDHQKIIWARYMTKHIGKTFDGNITGLAPFGAFVQLAETRVVGLVAVEAIGKGKVEFDSVERRLTVGKSVLEIGRPMKVKVTATDPEKGNIDLEPVEGSKRRRRRRR